MPWSDVDEFLKVVSNQIRYKKAIPDITKELKDHIRDRMEDFIEGGMDDDSAILKAVKVMGDPVEIGKGLNKFHRPYLGRLLKLTNYLIILLSLIVALKIIPQVRGTFEKGYLPMDKDIKYSIDLDEKAKIDDRTIALKRLIIDKHGIIYIYFNSYNNPFSHGNNTIRFNVYDDRGNYYGIANGYEVRGNIFVTRYLNSIPNFDKSAVKLILDYDHFNRKLRFEIPLNGGESL